MKKSLFFEKLSEGVWGGVQGGVRGAFGGRLGGVRWKSWLMAEQSIEKTYYFAVWQGGVRRMTPTHYNITSAHAVLSGSVW